MAALQTPTHNPQGPRQVRGSYRLLDRHPPVVYAMGLTYASHCLEAGEKPQRIVFEKRCVPTQRETLIRPPGKDALHKAIAELDERLADWLLRRGLLDNPLLDYEVELGLVLQRDVSRAQLAQPDFTPEVGYFVANDVTSRTVQLAGEKSKDRLHFWSASKSFSGFLPTSRNCWIPNSYVAGGLLVAQVETFVNNYERQSASTVDLMWTIAELLRIVCEEMELETLPRGAWILTGTPAGTAINARPWQRKMLAAMPRRMAIQSAIRANLAKPTFLRSGDRIFCRADGTDLSVESVVG
jgi:2-keto-4-pentenoate hydratase/2-oxohepta-3-ene-1,7-dioic acid hydratase in catechol pathway